MKRNYLCLGLLCSLALVAAARADDHAAFMQDMDAGMKKMDHGMANAPMTGNPDYDFAAMMIPHHQGAVDMAEVELKYGKDPALREMAKKIIEAQQTEIAFMRGWLAEKDRAAKAQAK